MPFPTIHEKKVNTSSTRSDFVLRHLLEFDDFVVLAVVMAQLQCYSAGSEFVLQISTHADVRLATTQRLADRYLLCGKCSSKVEASPRSRERTNRILGSRNNRRDKDLGEYGVLLLTILKADVDLGRGAMDEQGDECPTGTPPVRCSFEQERRAQEAGRNEMGGRGEKSL